MSYFQDSHTTVYQGDAREVLREMPERSVQTVVTSPPYLGLRDYKVPGQIGLESSVEEYVAVMVDVFREIRRVLRDDGTCWINLGDGYAHGKPGGGSVFDNGRTDGRKSYEADKARGREKIATLSPGCKPKDLLGLPWAVAFALRADGWWLRSDIVWSKPNPMPESIQGSAWVRHRVKLKKYESLLRLRRAASGDQDGTGNVSGLSAAEVSSSQATVSTEREGQGDSAATRGTTRSDGEAAAVLSVGAGADKQGEVRADGEGQREGAAAGTESARPRASGSRNRDGRGVAGDSKPASLQVSLLPEADDSPNDGSRNPAEQGRAALSGEHSAGLSELQLEEEQQDSSSFVDCPGCPQCEPHDGLVLRMSAGRPTRAHEYIFLLSKSASYHYDADAIREPGSPNVPWAASTNGGSMHDDRNDADSPTLGQAATAGRNKRTVWEIATQPYPDAHFATFPEALVRPCILAGTSERGACAECGAPWERVTERPMAPPEAFSNAVAPIPDVIRADGATRTSVTKDGRGSGQKYQNWLNDNPTQTTGWRPTCKHSAETQPCTVLDPFAGSGTTALVARKAGRKAILIELSEEYCRLIVDRIGQGVLL